MANNFALLGKQMSEIWRQFGVNQKVSVIMGLLVTMALTGGVLYWGSRPSYRLVYAEISSKDAATAVEKLEGQNIKTRLSDSGLYVPAKDVYKARMILANEGLPKNGDSAGFELFEKPKFGLTDFDQQINYQRALQGELERTISSIDGIASARVILVLPKDKIFASEEEKKASASIMVNLENGAALGPTQVASITRFVGSAVAGLSPSAITVTDQRGNLLSRCSDPAAGQVEAAGEQFEAQTTLENFLSKKAQAMLDKALGMGKSIVKVTADMDFSKTEKRNETYSAEGRVVYDETISSRSTSSPEAIRAAETATTTIKVGAAGKESAQIAKNETKEEDIKTKYKVPSTVEQIKESGAKIKQIAVSVCVARGEKPRNDEELKKIEDMISAAVGLVKNGARTDSIKVVEMDFPPAKEPPKPAWWQTLPISLSAIGNGLMAILLLMVIFIASRKIIARLSTQSEEAGQPITVALQQEMPESGLPGQDNIHAGLDYVTSLAEQNPRAIAAWIANTTKGEGKG